MSTADFLYALFVCRFCIKANTILNVTYYVERGRKGRGIEFLNSEVIVKLLS